MFEISNIDKLVKSSSESDLTSYSWPTIPTPTLPTEVNTHDGALYISSLLSALSTSTSLTLQNRQLVFIFPLAGRLVCGEKFPHPQTIRSSLTGNSNNFRFVIFNILFNKRPWRTQGWGGIIFQTQRIFCNAGTSKFLLQSATSATQSSFYSYSFPLSQK